MKVHMRSCVARIHMCVCVHNNSTMTRRPCGLFLVVVLLNVFLLY
jgi:hypothetical protein